MRNLAIIFLSLFFLLTNQVSLARQAQQVPPLERLHWCKNSQGKVNYQRENCPVGTTEVSSIVSTNDDGTITYEKLGATLDSSPEPKMVKTNIPADDSEEGMKAWRKSILRMLGFAVVFGIIAKVTGRSFLSWFFIGAGVNFALIVTNVLKV